MRSPFEIFDENIWIELIGLDALPGAIAFATVGLFYESGSCPVLGSIAFFAAYYLYYQLICWLGSIGASVFLAVGSLIAIYLALAYIKNNSCL